MFSQADMLHCDPILLSNWRPHPCLHPYQRYCPPDQPLFGWQVVGSLPLLANHIQVYSCQMAKIGELTRFQHPVEALAFSPTDNSLAAGAKDHRVYVWSPANMAQLQEAKTDEGLKPAYIKGGYVVTKLQWSPAGDQIAVIGTFKQAHVNNPVDGQVLYYLNNATDQLTCTRFFTRWITDRCCGADGILRIYETKQASCWRNCPDTAE